MLLELGMGNGKLNVRVMMIMNGDGISYKYWYGFLCAEFDSIVFFETQVNSSITCSEFELKMVN